MAWEALQLVKAHLLPMQPAPLVPDCQSSVPYIKASVYRSPLGGYYFFVPKISEDNMEEAQAGDTPDSYRGAPHHQPPMTPGMHSSARYATDADHKRAVASPSRPVSTIADANGTTPEMKTTAASSWNTKNLGWRVGVDCTAAASAGILVAPVVTAIDR